MRYIPRQEPVVVHGVTQTFENFVMHLLEDAQFNQTGAGIRAAVRIEQALKGEATIGLEEADWTLLAGAAERPSHGYPSLSQMTETGVIVRQISITRALLPFVEAVATASSSPLK